MVGVGAPFYSALYGMNYRLPNVTLIVAVGIHSVEGGVKLCTNHDIVKYA